MNKKKVLAIVISLVLVIAVTVPGTLAVSADQASAGTAAAPAQAPAPQAEETPANEETPAPVSEESPAAPEAPAEESAKVCTCDPTPAEGESHKEGCPLYTAPAAAASAHIASCSDTCTDKDCKCGCHLYAKIMACKTLDEVWAIMDRMTDEQWALLSEKQLDSIDHLVAELDAKQVPAQPEEDNNPQIESEIIYPTVTYTYVAPFGEPVTGGQK